MDEPAEQRAKGWDFAALVLLLFGGLVFVVGWVVGVILLWRSPRWLWGEKFLGTLVMPGGLLLPAFVNFWYVPGWGGCTSAAFRTLPDGRDQLVHPEHCHYEGITGPLGPILVTALVLASVGTVSYLGWRLRARPT